MQALALLTTIAFTARRHRPCLVMAISDNQLTTEVPSPRDLVVDALMVEWTMISNRIISWSPSRFHVDATDALRTTVTVPVLPLANCC
jgi:hypothetical protein